MWCSGQREEKHPSRPDDTEHDHGIHINGDDVDPPLLGAGGRDQQHLLKELAAEAVCFMD